MSVTENADLTQKSQNKHPAEISLEYDEEDIPADLTASDAAQGPPGEPANLKAGEMDPDAGGNHVVAPLVDDFPAADGTDGKAAADEITRQSEALPGGNNADINDQPDYGLQAEPPEETQRNGLVGLDADEAADMAAHRQQPEAGDNIAHKAQIQDNSEEAAAEKIEHRGFLKDNSPLEEPAEETTRNLEEPAGAAGFSLGEKIISAALIALIIGGFVLYNNPAWIGLTKTQKPATPLPVKVIETVDPIVQPVTTPPVLSERDQCLAKIEAAVRLRNVLLAKNEEIYDLDLHYRSGIAELEAETYQEIQRAGTTSYETALKNKRIELNMRAIQRRRAYIEGLAKPAFWLNSGSEELLYLVRKAQLALQLTEIAGGIDLNKHMRHIEAAIQKYSLSPEKLAVDPQQSTVSSLEKIWQQVNGMEPAGASTEKKAQLVLNPKDTRIINQICSGNFERIAELTNISSRAARCLAQMQGADLFLNGLMKLSPEAAQQLFQWQGNWICLNGLKDLSPAAAQYLFGWQGNWISLNGLSDFSPDLAKQLLKWEGQQLELMGLEYKSNEATQKTLNYLILWETAGGKVFVTDKIRQKMESLR